MKNNQHILLSWSFLLGLVLLLLNDFYLKAAYPGFLTGKLSDFAGLFIFPLFFYAFFPKYKKQIFLFTAVFFIYWKSPYADAFIAFWNAYAPFAIGRVVDYSDLWALVVLPFAYGLVERPKKCFHQPILYPVSAALAAFAFMATSYRSVIEAPQPSVYHFNYSLDSLRSRLYKHPYIYNRYAQNWGTDSVYYEMDSLNAYFFSDTIGLNWDDGATPLVILSGDADRAVMKLEHFIIRAPAGNKKQQKKIQDTLMYYFEQEIIEKLHDQL
jgi:hypothetical protein